MAPTKAHDTNAGFPKRLRMLVLLGGLLFAAFLLTSLVSFFLSRASIRSTILNDELPLTSDNIYSEIQRDLFEPILISSLMANDTFLKEWIEAESTADPDRVAAYLQAIQKQYGTISSFFVSNATKNYYHPDGIIKQVRPGVTVDEWFFRVRDMEQPYEINVDPDAANADTMTIFINYRVVNQEGEFMGATGVGLTVNAVKSLMQEYSERFGRAVLFYDLQGSLVLYASGEVPYWSDLTEDPVVNSHFLELLQKSENGTSSSMISFTEPDGAMVSLRFIPELDWILAVVQEADGTRPLLWKTVFATLLVCLVTAAILLSIIHTATRKYQAGLESRAEQLEKKNREIEAQARKLVEANEELDALHRQKDEFIGMTVHDLKNPLQGLLGLSGLMLDESKLGGEDRENLELIHRSGRGMLEKVHDLLKLTEVEDAEDPEVRPFDVVPVLHSVLKNQELVAATKKISMDFANPGKPCIVMAHEPWVSDIVTNLISNAIKYSPVGEGVGIRCQSVGREIQIEVSDHAGGIPEASRAKLFQKFGRLGNKPTGGENSTGLGLYIVKRMTERMGGRVSFDSKAGLGTTFRVCFPSP
jgi:signal transduction histidine kinase